MLQLSSAIALAVLLGDAYAVNNGLARTPQMGWNNWNALGCSVSEDLLLDTAKILVDTGLRDVGYNYVVLDDCWAEERGEDGYQVVDPIKFPNGMNHVSDQIHELGLLFGMYSSAGEMTCARYPGSLDYEYQDAESFAKWGIDYLKYDNCFNKGRFGTPEASFKRYEVMYKALEATGRSILYSLCSWGEDYTHAWANSIANSWRMSGDIYDSFTRPDDLCSCETASDPHCIAPGKHCSVLNIINRVAPYADRARKGAWNDLDMLEVGNGGMTDDEYKAHFSMWAALKSPLLMGNDLRVLSAKSLSILNNPAVIAVSQDSLGKPPIRISRNLNVAKDKYGMGETQVWSGYLHGGDQVVVFLNAANEDLKIDAELEDIFVADGAGGSAPQVHVKWDVYDLWANRMDDATAQKVLDSPHGTISKTLAEVNWYNSTEIPYSSGVKAGDERVIGKKIGSVEAKGVLSATVKKHSVEMYRLRSQKPLKRYHVRKDEL